ncbi:hypothetical protein GPALN_013001 [Globodera pallida]|nr:hypothetical protein GPALN_013001 [Globodera pallida]
MNSSTRRSLRPYIAPAYRLNFHSEDNSGASTESLCAQLSSFLLFHGYARASKRNKAKCVAEAADDTSIGLNAVRCGGVCLGLRSLLRLLNKRFDETKSSQEAQKRVLLVLLDAEFMKPTALRHVFALLALGSNSPPFFLLPGLSAALSAPLNLPRLSAIAICSNGPPELTLLAAQIRQCLRPIEMTRPQMNVSPKGGTSNSPFETPKLVGPAGKKTKRKVKRKK